MSNSICIQHSSVNGSSATLTGGLFSTNGNMARKTRPIHSTNNPQTAFHVFLTVENELIAKTATAALVRCFLQYFCGLAGVSGVAPPGTTRVTGTAAGVTGTGIAAATGTALTDGAAVAAAAATRASTGTASLSSTAGGGASATSACSALRSGCAAAY